MTVPAPTVFARVEFWDLYDCLKNSKKPLNILETDFEFYGDAYESFKVTQLYKYVYTSYLHILKTIHKDNNGFVFIVEWNVLLDNIY